MARTRKPVSKRKAQKWKSHIKKLQTRFNKHLGTTEGARVAKKLESAYNNYYKALGAP